MLKNKEQTTKKKKQKYSIGFSATLDLLFRACLLALSNSGRHERTAVCTVPLGSGPIEGCSAVLAVRRYCACRWLVCAFVVCAEAGSKIQLLGCLCCSEAMASRADAALAVSLQEERLPSSHVHLAVGTPQCRMTWTEKTWTEKSACLCREHATLAHTNTRASAVMVLLYCGWLWCCYYCCLRALLYKYRYTGRASPWRADARLGSAHARNYRGCTIRRTRRQIATVNGTQVLPRGTGDGKRNPGVPF